MVPSYKVWSPVRKQASHLARAVGGHRWPGQPIVRFGAIGTVPRSIVKAYKSLMPRVSA